MSAPVPGTYTCEEVVAGNGNTYWQAVLNGTDIAHGDSRLPELVRLANSHSALLEALQWIAANYENGHINHVDFRVEAKRRADPAIASATGEA